MGVTLPERQDEGQDGPRSVSESNEAKGLNESIVMISLEVPGTLHYRPLIIPYSISPNTSKRQGSHE